jgi:hypothetical protein
MAAAVCFASDLTCFCLYLQTVAHRLVITTYIRTAAHPFSPFNFVQQLLIFANCYDYYIMPITFIKNNLTLPSDAAVNHPHLIDLAASTPPYSDRSLKLPDAVATMLHNITTDTADHLANFLDTNHPSLQVIQQFRNTSNTDKFVIAKQGKKVLVSQRHFTS